MNRKIKKIERSKRTIQPEEVTVDPRYVATIEPLMIRFRRSLPEPNEVLVLSFRNYLCDQIRRIERLRGESAREGIVRVAQSIIESDISAKLELLEDKSLEEIYSISLYIFRLARKTLERDELLDEVASGGADFKTMMMRMAVLKKSVRPFNYATAAVMGGEAATDGKLAIGLVYPFYSARMTQIAALKDEGFYRMRIAFYEEMRRRPIPQSIWTSSSEEVINWTIREYRKFRRDYERRCVEGGC